MTIKKTLLLLFVSCVLSLSGVAKSVEQVYDFLGKGTDDEPFLISSYEDIKKLGEHVNSGESFKGKVFLQTNDIIFPNDEQWDPIGKITDECEYFFEGLYDGGGCTISNINCFNEYAAIFSKIGGTVCNLGVESGNIVGKYAGAITAYGGKSAAVVNCYNKASVKGEYAGGISGKFDGEIRFCWNLGEVAHTSGLTGGSGGITASGEGCVVFSYSDTKSIVDINEYYGFISDSYLISENLNQDFLRKAYYAISENRDAFIVRNDSIHLPYYSDNKFCFGNDSEKILYLAKSNFEFDFLSQFDKRDVFEGQGTVVDPFKIASYRDLCILRDNVATGYSYSNKYFVQTEDISFPDGEYWKPIGNVEKGYSFAGIYDGANHTLSNIVCFDYYAGLFSYLNGNVKNICIKNSYFHGAKAGTIASQSSKKIEIHNCSSAAVVVGVTRAGGIIDYAPKAEIRDCIFSGNIRGTSKNTVLAGIVSKGTPNIDNCDSVFKPFANTGKENVKIDYAFLLFYFSVFGLALVVFRKRIFSECNIHTPLGTFSISNKNKIYLIFFFAITLSSCLLTFHGQKLQYYFHQDLVDSFMDLFNSVVWNKERGGELGIYPPIGILPYKILARLVPWELFSNITDMREQAFSLRGSVYGAFILFIHFIPFAVLFFCFCEKFFGKGKGSVLYLCTFLLSGVMLYAFERGNNIIYAFLTTLFFVYFYSQKNERTLYKHLAYFSLAVAVSIKLYPAVFGLLLLSEKDIKGCFVTVLEFVVMYIVGFLLCGFSLSSNNVQQISSWTGSVTVTALGTNFSIKNFIMMVNKIFVWLTHAKVSYFELPAVFYFVTKLIILCSGIFTYMFYPRKWGKIASLSFMCIFIPDVSFQYVLLFLFIPLFIYIADEVETSLSKFYSAAFAIVLAMLIIPAKFGHAYYFASGGYIIQMAILLIFAISLFFEAIINFKKLKNVKKEKFL